MVIYADVLFALNFSMNYVSLYLAGKLTHDSTKVLRISIASAVGGVLGCAVSIIGIVGLPLLLFEIGAAVVMSMITFGVSSVRRVVLDSAAVFAVASLIGGIMTFGDNIAFRELGGTRHLYEVILLAISAFASVIFGISLLSARSKTKTAEITAELGGKVSRFTALIDSGNLVKDPISARPAILASADVLTSILGDSTSALAEGRLDMITSEKLTSRLRCVPVCSHGRSSLEYGVIPDKVTVLSGGKRRDVEAVIVPEKRSREAYGGFDATCPSSLT